MAHICVHCGNSEEFKKCFKHIADSFQGFELLVCTTGSKIDQYPEAVRFAKPTGPAYIFSTSQFEDFCHKELGVWFFGDSLGHAKNCLALASYILSPDSNLIMLGCDSKPTKSTASSYSEAFKSHDVVQGSIVGQIKNSAYAMVYLFEALEHGKNDAALKILSGNWKFKEKTTEVTGLSADNFGIRGELKLSSHFAPNSTFADHFYEFSLRLMNKSAAFMDSAKPLEIPEVSCDPKAYGNDFLVDSYAQILKDSIIESFFYFKTIGCIPKIIDGKHSLLAIKEFDIPAMAEAVARDAALPKFKKAAEHYIKQGKLEHELEEQLKKILWLDQKQFAPSEKDLLAEWVAFQEEGSKFKHIIENVSAAPESIRQKLEKETLLRLK